MTEDEAEWYEEELFTPDAGELDLNHPPEDGPSPYDNQYENMSAAAHRRPSPSVGAPALTWHRAFWKPDSLTSKDWHEEIDFHLCRVYAALTRSARLLLKHSNIDKHVVCENMQDGRLHLFRNIFDLNGSIASAWSRWTTARDQFVPVDEVKMPEIIFRHDRFFYRLDAYGFRVSVKAELHTEYWTLTVVFDFSELPDDELLRRAKYIGLNSYGLRLVVLVERIAQLHEIAVERSKLTTLPPESEEQNKLKLKENISEISRALVGDAKALVDDFINDKFIDLSKSGKLFTDAFGIILGLQPAAINCPPGANSRCLLDRVPKNHNIKRLEDQVSAKSKFDGVNINSVIDIVWPIARYALIDENSEKLFGKPEFTATLFQRGRALYISSLGRVVPEYSAPRPTDSIIKIEPILYFLICPHPYRRQLGRLVDHVHTLGTVRLAALRDIAALTQISTQIRNLERNFATQRYEKDDLVIEPGIEFGQIGTKIDGNNARTAFIQESVSYRVARSRHYVDEFEQTLKRLEGERVEGFQPYRDLVMRRMGGTFAFIASVGVRYSAVMERVRLHESIRQAKAATNLLAETEFQARRTNVFLRNGDRAFLFLLTYYIGGAIDHFAQALLLMKWKWLSAELIQLVSYSIGLATALMTVHEFEEQLVAVEKRRRGRRIN